MSLSVQPNTRKEIRNPQLSQFDHAVQMMLPNGVPMLSTQGRIKVRWCPKH